MIHFGWRRLKRVKIKILDQDVKPFCFFNEGYRSFLLAVTFDNGDPYRSNAHKDFESYLKCLN